MNNAWSHLPNAHHIDWVFNSVKENPELWVTAKSAARDAHSGTTWFSASAAAWAAIMAAARDAARVSVWDAAISAARDAAWVAARDAVSSAARSAIIALIAYDDCDQFLSMSYERLKVWATLSEDPRAILLLPMVYVKEKLNEQWLVTSAECTSY